MKMALKNTNSYCAAIFFTCNCISKTRNLVSKINFEGKPSVASATAFSYLSSFSWHMARFLKMTALSVSLMSPRPRAWTSHSIVIKIRV